MHIVVAEDNPADLFLLRQALKEHGLDVDLHWIDDGEEALHYFESLASREAPVPDAVLLDLSLPKVDGETILRYLRTSRRYDGVPVAVLSASERPEDRQRVAALGAHYLRKPSELADLPRIGAAIREMCERPRGGGPAAR